MKMTLLPQKTKHKPENDFDKENEPFYKGTNKIAAFILNNALYWVAFLIPLLLMLMMTSYMNAAPFGDRCMFVLEGREYYLPVIRDMVRDFLSGNLHALTLDGSTGQEIYSSIAYYLASPCTLAAALCPETIMVSVLTILTIVRIAMSAPAFLYYLTHRCVHKNGSKYDITMLIFAFGYSLSSYAVVQNSDFIYLDIFTLFPLLMLGVERMMEGKSKRLFLVVYTICFLCNFYMALMLSGFIVLYALFQNRHSFETLIQRLFRIVGTAALAFLAAAVTTVPGIVGLNRLADIQQMPEPSLFTNWYNFFLQYLFYGEPSFKFWDLSGVNLYIGMFALVMACFRFFDREIPLKKRLLDMVFLIVLVLCMNFSQVAYVCQIFVKNRGAFIPYSFAYLFVLLAWGAEGMPHLHKNSLWRVLAAAAVPVILTLVCVVKAQIKPNFDSALFSTDLLIVYAIILVLYARKSITRRSFYCIIASMAMLEIMANTFQTSVVMQQYMEEAAYLSVAENTEYFTENTQANSAVLSSGRREVYSNPLTKDQLLEAQNSRTSGNMFLTQADTTIIYSPLQDSFSGVRYLYVDKAMASGQLNLQQYRKISETGQYDIYENTKAFPAAYAVEGEIESGSDSLAFLDRQNHIADMLGSESDVYEEISLNASLDPTEDTEKQADFFIYSAGGDSFFVYQEYEENKQAADTFVFDLEFTPEKSGDLYMYSNGLLHFGNVEAGKTYHVDIDVYAPVGMNKLQTLRGFLYHDDALETLQQKLEDNKCEIEHTGWKTYELRADIEQSKTVITALPYSEYFSVYVDGVKTDQVMEFEDRLAVALEAGEHTVRISYDYIPLTVGIIVSIITILACVVFMMLRRKGVSLGIGNIGIVTARVIKENYVYILSFLLPFVIIVGIMSWFNCDLFGTGTLFTADGLSVEMPFLFSFVQQLAEGYWDAHSWIGAGGVNAFDYYAGIFTKWFYLLFPYEWIPTVCALSVVFKMSLTGLSLAFYLTHRCEGKRAFKKDPRVLIAALSYSLSSYMLLFFQYPGWYYALIMLPVILLGMDYLVVKGKKRYYILALTFSFFMQYYLTMFICFYLVIRFFTYHFEGIKDFVRKGFRFALSSLSILIVNVSPIYIVLSNLSGSTYGEKDAVSPEAYWFTGFDYLVRRQNMFLDSMSISWDEGYVNLYFGMLPLLLLAFYVIAKHVPIREKLRKVLPYVILYVTLTHSVANYIFNGFHYQNGVPNRFAFLIVCIAATLSYDALLLVKREHIARIVMSFILTASVMTWAFLMADSKAAEKLPFVLSLSFVCCYIVLLVGIKKAKKHRKILYSVLVTVFVLEVGVNAFKQIGTNISDETFLTDSKDASDYLKEECDVDNTLERVSIVASASTNAPLIYSLKSPHLFAAGTLTDYQLKYSLYGGNSTSKNVMMAYATQTPMGNAINCNRYIVYNRFSVTDHIADVNFYRPIYVGEGNAVYENEYNFPFAYYMPKNMYEECNEETDESMDFNDLWNVYAETYTTKGSEVIQCITVPNNNMMEKKREIDYFTQKNYADTETSYYYKIRMPRDGSLYARVAALYYIGEYKKGDVVEFTVYSNLTNGEQQDLLDFCIYDHDVFKEISANISKAPLEIEYFDSDTIEGTVAMPEDGMLNFSMPYDTHWKAYVDGTETETAVFAQSMLCIEVPEGSHEVKMVYEDGRTLPYTVYTACSWVLILVVCLLPKRRKNRQNA